jgi:hypothetical protein
MRHAFQESFHPNRAGTVALAQALATWLQAKCPGLWPTTPTFSQIVVAPKTAAVPISTDELWADVKLNMNAFCLSNPALVGCTTATGGIAGGGCDAQMAQSRSLATVSLGGNTTVSLPDYVDPICPPPEEEWQSTAITVMGVGRGTSPAGAGRRRDRVRVLSAEYGGCGGRCG